MVCEVIDSRIPKSSRNPDLNALCKGKRRMIVLNRVDQADPAATAKWTAYYREQGYVVMEADSQKGGFLKQFTNCARKTCEDLIQRQEAKGQVGKSIRIMIMGIPNVGKSSFINRLLGKKAAVAADKPGVTRGKQWFSLPGGFDFMDTPGMLWPKIDTDEVGFSLAFTGSIRDEILDLEDLACRLILRLDEVAPGALQSRYGIEEVCREQPYDTLTEMARKRGFLAGRGEYDTERMAKIFLDEFRGGKLGKFTLEMPEEQV
jgi:ribosome biogenesis GTPase A